MVLFLATQYRSQNNHVMNIEFHTAYGKVPDKLIKDIRDKVLEFSHVNADISRAEIILREDETIIPSENKVCEIRLSIYGDDLMAHSRTESFKTSAKEVLNSLKKMVKQQVKNQKEIPDQTTSTVKV